MQNLWGKKDKNTVPKTQKNPETSPSPKTKKIQNSTGKLSLSARKPSTLNTTNETTTTSKTPRGTTTAKSPGTCNNIVDLPGPGNYDLPHFVGKDGIGKDAPAYSLAKAEKFGDTKALLVGPGSYDYRNQIVGNEGTKIKIHEKFEPPKGLDVPGPGTYENKSFTGTDTAKYTIGVPRKGRKDSHRPGPGAYDARGLMGQAGMKVALGPKIKDPSTLNVPGPGAYEKAPGIGGRNKITGVVPFSSRREAKTFVTAAPGAYDSSILAKGTPRSYKIPPPHKDFPAPVLPGPGNYFATVPSMFGMAKYKTLPQPTKPKNPTDKVKFAFGPETRLLPGPGQYEIKGTFGGKGLRIAEKYSTPRQLNVPGPGAYESKELTGKVGHKVSMGAKLNNEHFEKELKRVPGPGAYEKPSAIGKRGTNIGIPLKDLTKPKVPGPGAYNISPKMGDKGGSSFSSRREEKLTNTITPGAGAYDVKPTLLKKGVGNASHIVTHYA